MLANGNIRTLQDVHDCMAFTGAAGVMSAETLLGDPALFAAPSAGKPLSALAAAAVVCRRSRAAPSLHP